MDKIEIISTVSVNKVMFGSLQAEVRSHFGTNYESFPKANQAITKANIPISDFAKRLAQLSGKTTKEFLEGVPSLTPKIFDSYSFGKINYDSNYSFKAFEILPGCGDTLIVDGTDCSDFKFTSFMKLAKDFIWDNKNTSWISLSKQISLYCPSNDKVVEEVLFGCKNYYGDLKW